MIIRKALLILLLASSLGAQAAIIIETDTATDFNGTFSFQGNQPTQTATASNFVGLLPVSDGIFGLRDPDFGVVFGTDGLGIPDEPFIFTELGSSVLDLSGSFFNGNNGNGTLVFFLLSDIVNEAGSDGTFSGNFAFSTTAVNPVPLPAAAWLFISAMGGLFGVKKLKENRVRS